MSKFKTNKLSDVADAIRALRTNLDENVPLGAIIMVNTKVTAQATAGAAFHDVILLNMQTGAKYQIPSFVECSGLVVKYAKTFELGKKATEQAGSHLRIAYDLENPDLPLPEWFTDTIASIEADLAEGGNPHLSHAERIALGTRLSYAKSVVNDSNNYAYVLSQINDAVLGNILEAKQIYDSGLTANPDPRWHADYATTMGTVTRNIWNPKSTKYFEAYARTYTDRDPKSKTNGNEVAYPIPVVKLGLKFEQSAASPRKLKVAHIEDFTIIDMKAATATTKPMIRNSPHNKYLDSNSSVILHEVTDVTLDRAFTPQSVVISTSINFKLVISGVGWSWTPSIAKMCIYRAPKALTVPLGGGNFDDIDESNINIGESSNAAGPSNPVDDFDDQ